MTDPSPSEFVAAHELSRYSPNAVMRLIEAAKQWDAAVTGPDTYDLTDEEIALAAALAVVLLPDDEEDPSG